MTTSTYTVVGMTCQHCVTAVTAELQQLPGVSAVEVELDSGSVRVESGAPLDPAAVDAAVQEAGYRLAPA